MTKTKLQQLAELADQQLSVLRRQCNSYSPMGDTHHSELYRLAVDVTLRPLIANKDLLPIFCDAQATATLYTMPIAYWFWRALREAVDETLRQAEQHPDLTIDKVRGEDLDRAIWDLRVFAPIAPQKPVTELTAAEVRYRLAEGYMLKADHAGQPPRVNPIFAPVDGDLSRADKLAEVKRLLREALNRS